MLKLLTFFLLLTSCSFAQLTREVWCGTGIQRKLTKNLEATLDINSRFYSFKEQLFYPELTFKYKVKKWFKPSIDYRGLVELNKYGNYKYANRLNFNLNFEKSFNNLSFGFRIRYQYVFNGIRSYENYSPEFDQTIRLKPSIKYDIKKSRFTPNASVEWFYNPNNGPTGDRFAKIRSSVGADIALKGPHVLSINYLYGVSVNSAKTKSQHILSIYYCFIWEKPKK